MKPRVLFMGQNASIGGAELGLLDIATYWGKQGTVVLLESGPFQQRLMESGVNVVVLEGGSQFLSVRREARLVGPIALAQMLSIAKPLARLARGFDLVYANSQKAMVLAAMAKPLSRRPLLWHLREIYDRDHFGRLTTSVAVALGNRFADRIVANSRATAEAFIANGGRQRKTIVVHNGIDSAAFDAVTEGEVAEVRRQLGLEGVQVIGIFGRISEWKGQAILIEALARLAGVHGLLVGEANPKDIPYRMRLVERAKQLGVENRVHFAGFRRDIPRLMRMVDVVAHTSVSAEPFGRVLVEGMLSGRPVIATRAGGALEIIQDGVTGWLVQPGDPEALATALTTILSHPSEAERIAQEGGRHARRSFSLESMLAEIEAQVNETVA